MAAAIFAAAVARPSARLGPLAVEAPDEDAFTLAVAAAEALPVLPGGGAPSRLDLVGDFGPSAEWGIPEALGWRDTAVHTSSGGPAHLFEAIRGHGREAAERTRIVLAVDRSGIGRGRGIAHGALAVALAIGPGTGIQVDHVAAHVRSPSEPPQPLRPEHLGGRPSGDPVALLLIGDDERLVAAAREAGGLGFAPSVVPKAPPGTGPAPTTPYALALRASDPETAVHPFVLGALGADRDVYVRGRVTGTVAWSESAPAPTMVLSAPPAPDEPQALDARSEGAYVPRARYLENLPSRWRLEADWCPGCGRWTFPVRGACSGCGDSEHLERRPLSRRDWKVEAATIVRPGAQPTEFDGTVALSGAYGVVIARSPEGPRGTFQVAGPAAPIELGTAVTTVLRRLYPMEGEWRYGRKALVVKSPA
ncbi:MAG: hypothetical protein L3K01_03365 [Thermoplasmata archaeon]|nr:hypothetical protein [Thermoplasmata archaeon]